MGLKFSKPNSKIDWPSFSLPAGWTCPGANECLAKVHVDDRGKRYLVDGKNAKFRCFSATAEAQYQQTYDARQHNLAALKALRTSAKMAAQLLADLPKSARTIRIHVSGDFFNQAYFDAWIAVAMARPGIRFYAYTKSLNFWVKRLGAIPENLVLTASEGGKYDRLIQKHQLKFARVVFSEAEAQAEGLAIDHDDSLASDPYHGPFALLLHGTQAPKSEASRALVQLRRKGVKGYSRGRKRAAA